MSPLFNTQKSLSLGVMLLISTTAFAQPPVVVRTYGQHVGGNIVYTQQVNNESERDVLSISIGEDTDYVSPNLPYTKTKGELTVFPLGSDVYRMEIKPGSVSGPSGWTAELIQIEHSGQYFIWRGPAYPEPTILPGQTATFRIVVPKYDAVYLTGHFSAHLAYTDGKGPWAYNGVMERLDITPPSLSVVLGPAVLRPSEKLVSITATITMKDDYDPAPEVKLESITANEPLEKEDIKDAQIGTDDRQFKLKAEREGKNKAGRIYTVTYSATDASGNQATASATVTVPHDERKKDDDKDEREKKD